jgi:spore germination cell wall hydrolase CwlJ-like protein
LGQYAVGLVTLNRVESDRFPDTVCGVVKQAKYWNNNPIRNKCHFSWYCDGKSDKPEDIVAWTKAKSIAEMLLLFHIEDFTNGATHYHAPYVSPSWSKEKKVAAIIGGHIFYD